MTAIIALILCRTSLIAWLEYAFIVLPVGKEPDLKEPSWEIATLLISLTCLAAALVVDRVGARHSFPYLGAGFLGFAILSLICSHFFNLDILFLPMSIASSLAIFMLQTQRLWSIDHKLTQTLIQSSSKLHSLHTEEAIARLDRGLKLLETVLSPREAIVFQRDPQGELFSAARLRAANDGSLDTSRNSVWREGINLCKRAIHTNEIITQQSSKDEFGTDVALPLRHENHAVGALLIRLNDSFEEDDRPLLLAVGAQLARNLQRLDACKSVAMRSRFDYISAAAGRRRLASLAVLNGLLSEQRFGVNAMSEISDGIGVAYLDGTLAHVNPPLLELAGLTEEEARELNVFGLLDTLRTDLFDDPALAVRRVLQTGEAYERELQFADRNGTLELRISLVHDRVAAVDATQETLCLVIGVRDLTRLKAYEQLKSDMISLMSHELRTPITSINGFAELLTADEDLPEQAKEFVTIILNESQRLSRMINTFLAVTQLERKDRQEVLKIPLRLDDIVRETVANLQPTAKEKRIRLVEQPCQRIPPVAADKSLISQAVKNLVSNAIKYSPERTTVTVSTALEAEAIRVSVEDRGFGIPPESVDRVWEKFFRVVREGQEKDEESTGLGLSFVREVVEQHGGAVELESEVGRGSKFSFTLPRL
ncbi:MAG: ATP-binding protein [bacterium]